MTIVFRPEKMHSVVRADRTVRAQPHDQVEPQALGSGMNIVCSPWEGIYLEQAYSFMPENPNRSACGG